MKIGPEEAEKLKELDGFLKNHSISFLHFSRGSARISVELSENVSRFGGIMNGGAILTFCDFAGALSTLSLDGVMNNFTVSMSADFMDMIDSGPVIFDSNVEKEGKNLAFVFIRVLKPEGILCARVHGIWKLIR